MVGQGLEDLLNTMEQVTIDGERSIIVQNNVLQNKATVTGNRNLNHLKSSRWRSHEIMGKWCSFIRVHQRFLVQVIFFKSL
jgi:hypothetical protein